MRNSLFDYTGVDQVLGPVDLFEPVWKMNPSDRENQNLTDLVRSAGQGDREALNRAWPMLYEHLHEIAANQMRGEGQASLLQTTAIVHEAYLKLAKQNRSNWNSSGEFLAAASVTMRRILVDAARKRRAKSRAAVGSRANLSDTHLAFADSRFEVLDIHEALEKLAEFSPLQSQALEMVIFGGASHQQIGETLGVSISTIERRIRSARAWLRRELTSGERS